MGRTLAIDYGAKRCGLAISDPTGIIANGLPTVQTHALLDRLKALYDEPGFDSVVVGLPLRLSGEASAIEAEIQDFIARLIKEWPEMPVHRLDERYTSKMAVQSMIAAGATKKQRRVKENVDKVSATLLLQEYLNTVV